jgi:hypothetical protein
VGRQSVYKKVMLKSDVLDLNGANNVASKLRELAAQRALTLTSFQGGQSELTCHSTTNANKKKNCTSLTWIVAIMKIFVKKIKNI